MMLSYENSGTVIRLTLQRPRSKVMHVICVCYESNKEGKQSAAVGVCRQQQPMLPKVQM